MQTPELRGRGDDAERLDWRRHAHARCAVEADQFLGLDDHVVVGGGRRPLDAHQHLQGEGAADAHVQHAEFLDRDVALRDLGHLLDGVPTKRREAVFQRAHDLRRGLAHQRLRPGEELERDSAPGARAGVSPPRVPSGCRTNRRGHARSRGRTRRQTRGSRAAIPPAVPPAAASPESGRCRRPPVPSPSRRSRPGHASRPSPRTARRERRRAAGPLAGARCRRGTRRRRPASTPC